MWREFASDNAVWEGLAAMRFSFYSLRQWKDEEEDKPVLTLYQSMDAANVMPHFAMEKMILLGSARLAGSVSAWTFLMERSNGETLRSVRRPPGMTGTSGLFVSLPVVELRTVVQNTGVSSVVLRQQAQSVDSSTRRKGGEIKEIDWDERFQKRVLNLDGTPRPSAGDDILCRLDLFEAAVIVTSVHAKGCSTHSKFAQRSNFTKLLVQVDNGSTLPLVIPFSQDVVQN